jgi:hypothetical protein
MSRLATRDFENDSRSPSGGHVYNLRGEQVLAIIRPDFDRVLAVARQELPAKAAEHFETWSPLVVDHGLCELTKPGIRDRRYFDMDDGRRKCHILQVQSHETGPDPIQWTVSLS